MWRDEQRFLLVARVCFVCDSRYVVSVGDSVGVFPVFGAEARFVRESALGSAGLSGAFLSYLSLGVQ